jgi:uncharacterized cofD-like protein
MENRLAKKKIVCLGSGMGTMNLISGLREYADNITVVATTTDDGGSGGRLRRLFNTLPPGDLVSCIAALSSADNPTLAKLLLYRFPGDRYGADADLGGQKLGNLMLVAAKEITGDYDTAVELLQKIAGSQGKIYPATDEVVTLSAVTKDGITVQSEENIDLGKYEGAGKIDRIFITPENPTVSPKAIEAIRNADVIIVGPGDLYTTTLPVLIIPAIRECFLEAAAEKIYIVNVANKPQETEGYTFYDFIHAFEKHIGVFPFHYAILNNNRTTPLSEEHAGYTYVSLPKHHYEDNRQYKLIQADIVDQTFSIYHDSTKLASVILKLYNKE